MADDAFKPALIVVDLQEDFCPPVSHHNAHNSLTHNSLSLTSRQNGALAVNEGRDVAPLINTLLTLPFAAKIATQDWHPADHISFASNHPGGNKQPFVDFATVVNPSNRSETYSTRLWPVHCVQHSPGAELIPELEAGHLDTVVKKGTDPRVEMYSAFYDPFEAPRVSDSGLAGLLRDKGVTHVYVVGLAFDYCVKSTAIDAVKEGFTTYVIEEGTRAVDAPKWEECKAELQQKGVVVVSADGPEVARLRA